MSWRLRVLTLTPLVVLGAAAAASHFRGVQAVVAVIGAAVGIAAVAVTLTAQEPPKAGVAVGVGVVAAAITTGAVLITPPRANVEAHSTAPPIVSPATTYIGPAQLRSADLHRADLSAAVLVGADLSGADLRDADLSGADLRGACFRGANLTGANWSGARFDGADFTGATAPPRPTGTASAAACATH